MKTIVPILALVVALAACKGKTKQEMLVGKWKFDHIAKIDDTQRDSTDIRTSEQAMKNQRLEITGDNRYRISDAGDTSQFTTGTYTLNPECTTITCKVDSGANAGKEFVNDIIRISEDTFILVSDRKAHLVFVRER